MSSKLMNFGPELQKQIENNIANMRTCLTNSAEFLNAERIPKMQKCQELSNEYSLSKFGVDTAENEPLKVCQELAKS